MQQLDLFAVGKVDARPVVKAKNHVATPMIGSYVVTMAGFTGEPPGTLYTFDQINKFIAEVRGARITRQNMSKLIGKGRFQSGKHYIKKNATLILWTESGKHAVLQYYKYLRERKYRRATKVGV